MAKSTIVSRMRSDALIRIDILSDSIINYLWYDYPCFRAHWNANEMWVHCLCYSTMAASFHMILVQWRKAALQPNNIRLTAAFPHCSAGVVVSARFLLSLFAVIESVFIQ